MVARNLFTLALVCALLFVQYVTVIVAWELRMRPQLSVIRPNTTVNILCQADSNTPLAACGFQISLVGYYDASMGAETPPQTTPYYTLQYYGTGLRRGQCGVRLTATVKRTLNVGCRAMTQRGGWKYDFMTYIVRETDTLPFIVEPRHQVMFPGQTVSVLFRVDEPLTNCQVKPSSHKRKVFVNFDDGISSVASTHFRYHGDGLASGECGITVFDVSEEDNEWIIFDVKTADGKTAYTTSLFPVAKPPTDSPELSLSKTDYVDGDMLEAQCTVAESRPPANITWYIGRDVIGENSVEEMPDYRWRWLIDPEKRKQKIKIKVTTNDDGKELRCVADHVGMKNTLQASKRIQVARTHTTDDGIAPECGHRNARPSLVAGGKDADDGEFPWHAGLYTALTNGTYIQACGGTLVKPNVVITAAHCVYDERLSKVKDKTAYQVVLGKLLRDWYADLANTGVQRREVDSINVPRNYRGRRLDYRYDIAILKLSVHVVITHSVNIACVNWDDAANSVPPLTGDLGVVAGWGVTSIGKQAADVLQWVDLPYADSDTCHNATPLETQKYITNDKFCAGYVERNTSVCQGDSGGGILFQDKTTKRYFLRGIVSTNLVRDVDVTRCNAQLFTTFTSLADYMKWVKKIVSSMGSL